MNLNFIDMTTEVINKEVSLSRKNVADVFVPKQIAWVSVGTPLEDVLKVLKENSILSVPVMDLATNKCLGTIDVLDIASFVVTRYPNINEVTGDSLRDLEVSGYYFGKQTTAGQLIAWSKGLFNPQMPQFVELTTPVLGLTDLFAQGIHRVPVIDTSNENKLISFISQSDLLRFFAEHLYVLGSLGDKTVQDLGLVSGGVHFVTGNARTILALNLIANKRVSAVPVVDSEGVLRCSISASDLRGLGPQQFDELLKPVAEYLTLWSPKSLFPLVCKPYHTLEYVVLKLAATKVHRLWVVDDFGKLLGVISITDVMKTFIRSPMDVGYQGFTLEPSTATATYGYLDVKNV